MSTIPSIEEYKLACNRHDWYYEFSDDIQVWRRGCEVEATLMNQARKGGDEYKKVFNAAHAAMFNKPGFVGPYVSPFPEVK